MRDYACIMLGYKTPKFIKEIQKEIDEDDIYFGETEEDKKNNVFGMENEGHITIVYGIPMTVEFKEIKPHLKELDEYKTILVNISTFENDDFDVLKVTAKCPKAKESNKSIMDNFDITTDYPDFEPHMTICYLKKGTSKKYTKEILDRIDTIKPNYYFYSYSKDGKDVNERYETL